LYKLLITYDKHFYENYKNFNNYSEFVLDNRVCD